MKAFGTYLQNDPERPLRYGEVELINPPRQRLRGEPMKEGILAKPVIVGFCGTDHELMEMGRRGELTPKFPAGQNRLINGHEGVVWVPEQHRFAIVLIRGGDSVDPTRFTEDETYFEYGCDQADGLFCDSIYVNPDMLLPIPDGHVREGRLALSFAKKMVFPDPFACMLFQLERMEDLGGAHWIPPDGQAAEMRSRDGPEIRRGRDLRAHGDLRAGHHGPVRRGRDPAGASRGEDPLRGPEPPGKRQGALRPGAGRGGLRAEHLCGPGGLRRGDPGGPARAGDLLHRRQRNERGARDRLPVRRAGVQRHLQFLLPGAADRLRHHALRVPEPSDFRLHQFPAGSYGAGDPNCWPEAATTRSWS